MEKRLPIIPYPRKVIHSKGFLDADMENLRIYIGSDDLSPVAGYFTALIKKTIDLEIPIEKAGDKSKGPEEGFGIYLEVNPSDSIHEEGYKLEIGEDSIEIRGKTPQGVFYGIQTLRQLLPPEWEINFRKKDDDAIGRPKNLKIHLPRVKIEDYPEFKWRGFMLDVCRHFHGKDTIKMFLELMALLKMNIFHWHLTEDQGWRLEIEKYPKLIEIGSKRKDTQVRCGKRKSSGRPHSGYFTKEDVKEILAYARERFITVVPEIEIPGHSQAAIAAYPELSCEGKPVEVATTWGIKRIIYCAGKDSTFQFWYDVLDEVMELFPSEVIHTGGDEVPKEKWKKCQYCQARIKEQGLKDEEELQVYVTNTIASYLASKGRRLMGWSEILDDGLAPNAICHYWAHNEKEVIEHAKKGRDIVISKTRHLYLDYSYSGLPLKKVYELDPYLPGIPEEQYEHILGIEAPLWTEWVPTRDKAEWQTFPRLLAVSEVAWLARSKPVYEHFNSRVDSFTQRLDRMGVRYAKRWEHEQSLSARFKRFINKLKGIPADPYREYCASLK